MVQPLSLGGSCPTRADALLIERRTNLEPLLSAPLPLTPSKRRVPRPFVKWVGGKTQLLPALLAKINGLTFTRYAEPFVGGGALFFEMHRTGLLPNRTTLLDINPSLIETYEIVRDDVDTLLEHLQRHAQLHSNAHYYHVRSQVPETPPARAARLIYLNKTGFNGLYRENRKGQFNVPMGRYANPAIVDEPNLRAASVALQGAVLQAGDFETVLSTAGSGTFVYFDPPYVPVSRTAAFTNYSEAGFSMADQRRLAGVFGELTRRGIPAMLSNSYTPAVLELYSGFHISEVSATRAVNSDAASRGKVSEAIVTNFE